MPEAATRISTSPGPATGIGRSVRCSTSGPPGRTISTAFTMRWCGSSLLMRVLLARRLPVEKRLHRQLDPALLVGLEHLDANDLAFLQKVGDLLDALVRD